MTVLEKATSLFNRWVSFCLQIGPEEQGILLIEMIAEAIDQAEQEGYQRAVTGTVDR